MAIPAESKAKQSKAKQKADRQTGRLSGTDWLVC